MSGSQLAEATNVSHETTKRRLRLAPVLALALLGCGQTPSGQAVKTYVGHIHAGQDAQAYAMLTAKARETYDLEAWKAAMHTATLADAQSVSISGIRTFNPGGICVYGQLDFVSRPDQGPYGAYTFYLQDEGGQPKIVDVMTYDRIEGEGLVKTTHFDESREPWPCSSKRQ